MEIEYDHFYLWATSIAFLAFHGFTGLIKVVHGLDICWLVRTLCVYTAPDHMTESASHTCQYLNYTSVNMIRREIYNLMVGNIYEHTEQKMMT